MTQISRVSKNNTNIKCVKNGLKNANLVSLRGTTGRCTGPEDVGEGLTFRNLIIPRVVKATRNIDTKTGRSDNLKA